MQEDEFDEFEEATYSTSTTHAQNANSSLAEFSPPIQIPSFNQDGLQTNNIQPFSTLAYNSADPFQLDMQSSQKSEQVWPHLNKISSVQESTQNGFFLDFTKSSSVKEEINHSKQQQSLNYLPSSTDPVQYNIFMQTNENINKESFTSKVQDNDFLLGFSSKGSQLNTIDVSTKNTTDNLFNWQAINSNPIPYTSNQDNYELFSKTNDKSGQDKQIYPILQQKVQISMQNQVFQFQKQETKQKQNKISIQNSINEDINQHRQLESEFLSMNNVESKDMRKQSEQFVFEQRAQQAILPQEEQNKLKEVDYQQLSKNTHQQINEQQIDQFQVVQVQLSTHPAQLQQTYNSLVQQPIQEKIEQPSKQEEEDDDFGDFQQTTVNYEAQTPPFNSNQQDTTIHIKEEYVNSNQSEFYQSKAKELQHFVDSLPNFSYLFMKAFAN